MAVCSHEDVAGPRANSAVALCRKIMGIMSALRRSLTYKPGPANFDVMGVPGGEAIVRGKPMNSPVFLADSHHLPSAMNDVGINTVCHGDLGDRRAKLDALRHHLRLRHRSVPRRACPRAYHRVQIKLDAHDPYRRVTRNQNDWAGHIQRTAALSNLAHRGSRPNGYRGLQ